MKKLLAMLLVLALTFSLAACSGGGDNAGDDNQQDDGNTDVEMVPVVGGQIIYGSNSDLSGDWGRALWTNNAADKTVRDLIDDYGTIVSNQGGEYVVNPTVVDGDIETTINDDGTRTYTVKIKEGLVYNNGEPITAKDYVAETLFGATPVLTDLGGSTIVVSTIVGAQEYYDGTADCVSGIRLIDEYTYSFTVLSNMVPYFYEITYAAAVPMNIGQWFGEGIDIADDGEGCYFTGDFTTEALEEQITFARYDSDNRVSAGPYTLVNYDAASKQATLKINENYAGNFEGQMPHVETIVLTKAEEETWADMIATGGLELYDTITEGEEINTALDFVDEGGFGYDQFDRAGYGKIQFACDFGPTQFASVRQAIAMLFDRNEFAESFCAGWGGTVDGPYGTGMWQYQDTEQWLSENLNTYPFDVEGAKEVLDADGWNLDAEGNPYESGIRYKEVTAEQAENDGACVTLSDGRILMPCIIEWCNSEGNAVSEKLTVMLANNASLPEAGVQINATTVAWADLLNYLYRDASEGEQYGVPTYNMFNLATGFTPQYDQSYNYSTDPAYFGVYNNNFITDEELAKLANDMVYGVEAGDKEAYLECFKEFLLRWNELLPDIPLYSNVYITLYPEKLKGYDQDAFWDFAQAIVYSWIDEEPAE